MQGEKMQMARRQLTEKEKLYAKVILDFANAEDTNKAGLQYIENVQRAFGLSDEFRQMAVNTFPVESDAKGLISKTIERREKTREAISFLGAADIEESGHCFFYNDYEFVESTKYYPGFTNLVDLKCVPRTRSFMESESEFIHYNIYNISCLLNDSLSCLYNNESFLSSDQMNSLINEYKESYDISISTNWKITERPIVPEGYIFNVKATSMDVLYDALRTLYKKPISYCLVSLLRIDDFRKRLKKCNVCSDFFLSYDGKLRCSETCKGKHKRIYMRDYMKEYPR